MMGKWVPTKMHFSWGGERLCGERVRTWPEEYMSESAGLYQKLPKCTDCEAELMKRRQLIIEKKERVPLNEVTAKNPRVYELNKVESGESDNPVYLVDFDYKKQQ